MKVILLQHTSEPERVVAQAAKLCYSAVGVEAIDKKLTSESIDVFIRKLLDLGHLSAFEHASFTFGIEGVSRALTHQLVRHRLASYSQQSQRYVGANSFPSEAIIPESIKQSEFAERFEATLQQINTFYQEMCRGNIPFEDARYILPNACETKLVATMNARELLHFFALRCCNRAQWEIHALADEMLKLAKKYAPTIFYIAGPNCMDGFCSEGNMTCGRIDNVRAKYILMKE